MFQPLTLFQKYILAFRYRKCIFLFFYFLTKVNYLVCKTLSSRSKWLIFVKNKIKDQKVYFQYFLTKSLSLHSLVWVILLTEISLVKLPLAIAHQGMSHVVGGTHYCWLIVINSFDSKFVYTANQPGGTVLIGFWFLTSRHFIGGMQICLKSCKVFVSFLFPLSFLPDFLLVDSSFDSNLDMMDVLLV